MEGLEKLKEYMVRPDRTVAEALDKKEMEANELRRILIDELLISFSTPIDREDIFSLSRAIDDIIDYATSTVDEMILLKVAPAPYLEQMVEKLATDAREIMTAIERIERNPHVAGEHAVRAKRCENDVEKIYRKGVVELLEEKDFISILKKREIYRHLSNAADRCDEAANIIADMVVKSV